MRKGEQFDISSEVLISSKYGLKRTYKPDMNPY
jgi:hypothetical protein